MLCMARPLFLRMRPTLSTTHVCNLLTMAVHQKKQLLTLRLHEVGAVKFGRFTLKSGVQSPVYVDLRVMVSHPTVMVRASGRGLA